MSHVKDSSPPALTPNSSHSTHSQETGSPSPSRKQAKGNSARQQSTVQRTLHQTRQPHKT